MSEHEADNISGGADYESEQPDGGLDVREVSGKVALLGEVSEKAFLSQEKVGEQLNTKAEKLIAAVGLVVGLHVIDVAGLGFLPDSPGALSPSLAIAAFVALGLSLMMALAALQLREFHSYGKKEDLFAPFADESVGLDEVRVKVALMYLDAAENNRQVNFRRSISLRIGVLLLVVGLTLAIISRLVALS